MGKDADLLEGARNGKFQVVEKILSSKARRSGPLASLRRGPGANIQDSSGYTGLHHAALNGHKDVVSLFLSHEASVNIQDQKGSTPLHLACWAGHNEVVKTLLLQGPSVPNVNHQNKGGETALHCAAQYGHTEAAELLLSRGGDPTISNIQAETPLDLASQYGRLHTAELLLRAHPDLLRPYTAAAATAAVFPHTPLHRSSRNGHLAVVNLLLSQGHHVNVRTGQGAPLHEAALCGKTEVVKVLLEAGADAEVRNDLGHTVLDTICSINTPVTQEITSLIKCHHTNQLINLDDDADDNAHLSDDSRPPSWLPSPPASLILTSPHDFGSPYENVLVPTRLHSPPHSPPADGESLSRFSEQRTSSRASDRDSRTSDRDSRTSDKECRMSDRDSHIVSDGRNSVASRMSEETSDWSVYDVPPPPKSLPDRTQSLRLSECEDDGMYEVPPPPRSCRSSMASLHAHRNTRLLQPPEDSPTLTGGTVSPTSSVSSITVTRRSAPSLDIAAASKVVEMVPPPKPPRRSMCPPSPTPESVAADQDSGAYEFICFAASGNKHHQSENESVDVRKSNRSPLLGIQQQQKQQHTSRSGGRPASSYAHDSSDSEYEIPRPTSAYIHSHGHSNKTYGTISFKPVKKSPNKQEQTPTCL
ncbi:unnamed protein product [Meganyctiphanes norvegica]|uniref:Ankyrin repeat and sterile alpha motif domain-containing protein 1B n=1 Tax=Meganyctiphanes norvegica TaxID=48144 RepID=A0AAV2QCU2_MEGNR